MSTDMHTPPPSPRPASLKQKLYRSLARGEMFLRHFLLLAIRVYWGGLLFIAGLGKWMNLNSVTEYFSSLNVPYPIVTVYAVSSLELIGGLSLFFGCLTRIFSPLLSILFFMAYATAHREALSNFFVNPSNFVQQEPFLYLYAALIILCFGPGLFSIDFWMEKRAYGRAL